MNNEEREPLIEEEGDQETKIAEYLADHTDFFERHLDLLLELRLPHQSGGAVSLLERQLAALRGEVGRYRSQLAEFITVARDNETLHQRMHRLTLTLLEPGDLDELVDALRAELQNQFQADAVELKLFDSEMEVANADDYAFQELLERGRPLCGRLEQDKLQHLFGERAPELGSSALIPLKGQGLSGILAISSCDPERFHPGKGTEFLVRLGELLTRRLEVASRPG